MVGVERHGPRSPLGWGEGWDVKKGREEEGVIWRGRAQRWGQDLDVHLVICGPMDRAVEPEADHEDAFVDREPEGIRGRKCCVTSTSQALPLPTGRPQPGPAPVTCPAHLMRSLVPL